MVEKNRNIFINLIQEKLFLTYYNRIKENNPQCLDLKYEIERPKRDENEISEFEKFVKEKMLGKS